MARTLKQIRQQLNPYYKPQIDMVKQQLGTLPGEEQAALSSLDQAKVNAFRDITETANRKGMLFSGFAPEEQARFLGEKFLPARANVSSRITSRRYQLQDALNNLGLSLEKDAQKIFSEDVKNEQQARKIAEDRQYKQAQLQIQLQKLAMSQGNASAAASRREQAAIEKERAKFKVKQRSSDNGYMFSYNGRPVSLGEYVAGTGGDVNAILGMLKNGSSYDRKVYNSVNIQLRNKKIKPTPEAIMQAIQRQDGSNFYGLR